MNKPRLLALARFLDNLSPERFNYETVIVRPYQDCGAAGCAIGWCPAVPELSKYIYWASESPNHQLYDDLMKTSKIENASCVMMKRTGSTDFVDVGMQLFSLTEEDSSYLFMPDKKYDGASTPKMVAKKIREFIKTSDKIKKGKKKVIRGQKEGY